MKLIPSIFEQALPASVCYQATGQGWSSVALHHVAKEVFAPYAMHDYAVSIDTRTITNNSIFVALAGEHVNGHDFLEEALGKGAVVLVIEKKESGRLDTLPINAQNQCIVIGVEDTRQALIALAHTWRSQFTYPIVGITGSVGKTTTKEMVRSILAVADIHCFVSYKNQNTDLGLALNLLRLSADHRAGIFEVGINERGEMAPLAHLLQPSIGCITEIAHVHTKGLGTLADIAAEKRTLFSLFEQDNIGIISADNRLLDQMSYAHPVLRFGSKMRNQVQARRVKVFPNNISFVLRIYQEKSVVRLQTPQVAFVNNALAASAICTLLGVPISSIVTGLEQYQPFEGRFEQKFLPNDQGIIIDDCYNASPQSMKAALCTLDQIPCDGRKIAVLGDMLELGAKELFWHRQIGRQLCRLLSIHELILVGERAAAIAKTAPLVMKITTVNSWQEAFEILLIRKVKHSLILVKGSRGMQLDRLVTRLMESSQL